MPNKTAKNEGWKWHAVILGLLILLALILSSGVFTGKVYYYKYGGGGSGLSSLFGWLGYSSFSDLYYAYQSIIDAIIFLVIFLGVSKAVFQRHFGAGGNAVFIGVGLFLAFALLLYEEREGFSLMEKFGPVVLVIFVFIVLFAAFRWLHEHHVSPLVGIALFLVLLVWFGDELAGELYKVGIDVRGVLSRETFRPFFYISLIILIVVILMRLSGIVGGRVNSRLRGP